MVNLVKRGKAFVIKSNHIVFVDGESLETFFNAFFQKSAILQRIAGESEYSSLCLLCRSTIARAKYKSKQKCTNYRLHNKVVLFTCEFS